MVLYKNGALVDSATVSAGVTDNTVSVGSFGSASHSWVGTIDDVRVYEVALSGDQIASIYANGDTTMVAAETAVGEDWQCEVTPFSATEAGATEPSNTLTITTGPTAVAESDDFDRANLDPSVWTFVDPVGDSSVAMTGTGTTDAYVEITTPAGASHDPWAPNNAARILQSVDDTDFEIEAKWDSVPTEKYQMQGIMVEQDTATGSGSGSTTTDRMLRAFSASIVGGSAALEDSVPVTPGTSVWLKVNRTGDTWTMWFSDDGSDCGLRSARSARPLPSHPSVHTVGITTRVVLTRRRRTRRNWTTSSTRQLRLFRRMTGRRPTRGIRSSTPSRMWPTGPTEATILFFTDEPTTGTVEFGEDTGYGSIESDEGSLYAHSIVLSDLVPGTTYHYFVSAEDAGTRTAQTGDFEFTFAVPSGPEIDIWYGDTQTFGAVGTAQPYINVLGNVSDTNGVASLSYTLNGGSPTSLTIGPDNRRLEAAGDFNVDLAFADLSAGSNTVVITATDGLGLSTDQTVTVINSSNGEWANPYSIDWSTAHER